jgi:hypothetical protein
VFPVVVRHAMLVAYLRDQAALSLDVWAGDRLVGVATLGDDLTGAIERSQPFQRDVPVKGGCPPPPPPFTPKHGATDRPTQREKERAMGHTPRRTCTGRMRKCRVPATDMR